MKNQGCACGFAALLSGWLCIALPEEAPFWGVLKQNHPGRGVREGGAVAAEGRCGVCGALQCPQQGLDWASPEGHEPASSGARSRRPLVEQYQKMGPVGAGVDLGG